ncbi:hypothetical protein BCR33DRAFT_856497 [Rhizoclosmatium globosum]|uniref:Uncharacterized protein n=1 Tax=Rhizoclosmatium globosum TaxID=329046 RepID=A0A1Y2BC42_9FUNG|nr:hypothetical protein BCR33DRAFT_856497 [Rhizoclosmatium globosum]|eukprot:ORY32402.1 hypothetical protein BCR33DRAFT_856497 [Rhizoclosmatium globosum]
MDLNFDSDSLGANTSGARVEKPTAHRKGRKPKEVLPEDPTARKNLEAVRSFRQRQKEHVESLEREVQELRSLLAGKPLQPQQQLSNQPNSDLESLRMENASLAAQLSLLKHGGVSFDFRTSQNQPNSNCIGCAVEKMKTLVCMGQIKTLEGKLAEAHIELQSLRSLQGLQQLFQFNNTQTDALLQHNLNAASLFAPDMSLFGVKQSPSTNTIDSPASITHSTQLNMTPWLDDLFATTSSTPEAPTKPTATELYGPPEVDTVRIALKQLPSLKDCKFVDLMMDTFVEQCKRSDQKWMIKSLLRTMSYRHNMLDACNIMDRQKVLELLVIFAERNKNHLTYRNTIINEGVESATKAVSAARALSGGLGPSTSQTRVTHGTLQPSPLQKRLVDELLKIPSLANSKDTIIELCVEMQSHMDSNTERSQDSLINLMRLGKQLESMCQTLEDKTKFAYITESFREGNRAVLTKLYQDVQDDSE